jgi:hypothetical protein
MASSVLLGCPIDDRVNRSPCAVQYGNLATIAGWLDLNQDLKAEGCFSLCSGEGKLGTVNEVDNEVQFRGLVRDYAVIETEETEQISTKASEPEDPSLQISPDDSKVEIDLILVNLDGQTYRLSTRIRTEHYSRIINPSQAMAMAANGLPSYVCSQDHLCQKPFNPEDAITTYSFDDMLGRWQFHSWRMPPPKEGFTRDRGSSYHVSRLLDTHLKLNVAYAISEYKLIIINREGPYIGCAIAHCEGQDKEDQSQTKRRFIVNTAFGKKKPRLVTSGRSRRGPVQAHPESP